MTSNPRKVIVIIGIGGMGLSIARRLASGHHLVFADYSDSALLSATTTLQAEGHLVTSHTLNIVSYPDVCAVAVAASKLGPIAAVVHTAGVAPGHGNSKQIFEIDLLGTANVIDAFLPVASVGTSLVCIASMAGHMMPVGPEMEKHLATAPRETLLDHTGIDLEAAHPGMAYSLAKRGNQLRVQAAAKRWGAKGARVNSVSPGVISTGLVQKDLEGKEGESMRGMIQMSAAGRIGTPEDITSAVAFLVGEGSSFITGTDLLVDGGTVAGRKWG
jgi:NAD(P)-dependent dehydrogenase (short-subunit alcohol dehydrogenase family)